MVDVGCLNSTMVRLKPSNFFIIVCIFVESQFHYGSIKTKKASDDYKSKAFCLNSTMVRLKQDLIAF